MGKRLALVSVLVACGGGSGPTTKSPVVNTVGAGDAMLAGAARAINSGLPPESWLQWGLACGSAAVRQPAGVLPARTLIERLVRGFVRKKA